MQEKPRVVFAGLGAMGWGMASHLLHSGYSVTGYDVYRPAVDRFVAQGGLAGVTPRAASQGQYLMICMVANSSQVTSLLFDQHDGAAAGLAINATILICSTVAPAYVAEVQSRLVALGRPDIRLVDSPVSGGATRAADGTLSIFSSGATAHLETVNNVLECLSARLYRVPGGLGGGSKAKLIHQIFAGVNIAMSSEAMALVARAGLDTRRAFQELKDGPGNSWMFGNRVPHMLDPTLPPYSAVNIIAKDVGIITQTARQAQYALPMISTAEQLYSMAIANGWGQDDDCMLTRLYLPGQNDLIATQHSGAAAVHQQVSDINVDDIKNMMVAVHLAGMSEAMGFCEHLGIDTDLMFDIVANAAGASAAFTSEFKTMQSDKWSVRAVEDYNIIAERLVSICNTLLMMIG